MYYGKFVHFYTYLTQWYSFHKKQTSTFVTQVTLLEQNQLREPEQIVHYVT